MYDKYDTLVARRRMLPLEIAFAMSIHNAGQMLSCANLYLYKAFAPAQAYVGLSRVREIARTSPDSPWPPQTASTRMRLRPGAARLRARGGTANEATEARRTVADSAKTVPQPPPSPSTMAKKPQCHAPFNDPDDDGFEKELVRVLDAYEERGSGQPPFASPRATRFFAQRA